MSPSRRKDLPPPSGGDQLAAVLRRRHTGDPVEQVEQASEAAPAPQPAPEPPATPRAAAPTARAAAMDRRSWYMPKATADALAAAVDDLHYATRTPKHAVLAALVDVALAHVDEADRRLG